MRKAYTAIAIAAIGCHALGQAGALDPTFGTGGKVTGTIANSQAMGVVVQSDGKIVAGGYRVSTGAIRDFMLQRYNVNGSPDPDFYSLNGVVITNIDTSGNGQDFNNGANAIALQPDGKIIAAGFAHTGTDQDFALVRYNSDGLIDSTFNQTGVVLTNVSGSDECMSMLLQPDGKIIAGGYGGNPRDVALARYNADGTLDPTFGSGGIVMTDLGTNNDVILSMALQSDGKVVAGGVIFGTTGFDLALMRYNTDGSLDPTFNMTGIVIMSLSAGYDHCRGVGVTATGKIVAVGSYDDNASFALVQLNSDGTPDNAFGTAGVQLTSVGPSLESAIAVLIQPDGKILAGGYNYGAATDDDFALVRYDAFGDLDPAFDLDGKVTTDFTSGEDDIHALALQPDGKIIAAGYTQGGLFALARYTNDLVTGADVITGRDDGIMTYPNPSVGDLTVEWKSGTTALLRVVDLLGAVVSEQRMTSPARLSVPASGIYFLEITDGSKNVVNTKIVVE